MIEEKHTQEPWELSQRTRDGVYFIEYRMARQLHTLAVFESINLEDAKRIVDCVNACAGINPAAVPDLLKAAKDLAKWCSESRVCECPQQGPCPHYNLEAAIFRAESKA